MPSARGTCQLSRCEDGGPSRESEDLKPARLDRQPHLAHQPGLWPLALELTQALVHFFPHRTFVVFQHVLKDL